MPTNFEEIYKRFLNSIDDDMFSLMEEVYVKEKLFFYMERAIALKCKDIDNVLNYDIDLQQFNTKLSIEEINLIVLGMEIEYLNEQVQKQELMRQAIGNRDFTLGSNHLTLKAIKELKESKELELRNALISYTYNNFEGFE